MARDRIVASDPEDLARILDLWSLRLSSLARLRLTNQASAECTNLFAVLNAVITPSVPGSFPGSAMPPSVSVTPSSPSPSPSVPLSPSGLGGLAQLPGTPSKPSALQAGTNPTTAKVPQLSHPTPDLVHPFELTVFHARVHYWSGDPLGYVDTLSRILGQCKQMAREEARVVTQRRKLGRVMRPREGDDVEEANEGDDEAKEDAKDSTDAVVEQYVLKASQSDEEDDSTNTEAQDEAEEQDDILVAAEANLSMWLERVARVCLILASQMIEMNDYQAAINLLAPLCTQRTAPTLQPTPSPELHAALARIYILSGNLAKAEEHFSIAASAAANAESDAFMMNAALMATASGDWPRAEEALTDLVAKQPENFTAMNNLAVTLLCQGRIKKGIDLLETALKTSPSSVVVAEPFLFNLSTMYELRSTAAIDKKRELLIEVAKWSGDGLKTSCLKMPSS
ncbi:hypothetical protein JVU11DRAFT_6505 [Chiua virens]|nr:hypothetical protein JVU11DRAFT_6505 [Chiua virens]